MGWGVVTGATVSFLSTKEHSRLCDKPPTCLPADWTAADHPLGKAGSEPLWNLCSLGSRPWLTPAAREPSDPLVSDVELASGRGVLETFN